MAKVTFGEIARECRLTFKGDKTGIPIVGLEHIVPNEMLVKDYEVDTENTFTKAFKKGQILFGRRRAYQQKASVATFDGICSGDITVIEAIPGKVDENLLPFIIQNEAFFNHAVQGSAGSLSPRVKWEHLASYELNLPSLSEQKALADKLWAAYRLKESYKRLLAATDEMVKSQFIELFANTEKGVLSDVATITMGQSPDGKTYNDSGDGMPFYQGKTEFGDLYIGEATTWTTAPSRIAVTNDVLMSVRAPVGSTNIAISECCIGRGLASIRPIEGKTTTMFILYAMRSIEDAIANMGVGSTFNAINKDQVYKLPIPIADIDLQNRFVDIAQQADKSKFELRKSIDAIDKVIKSLINN